MNVGISLMNLWLWRTVYLQEIEFDDIYPRVSYKLELDETEINYCIELEENEFNNEWLCEFVKENAHNNNIELFFSKAKL